MPTNKIIHTYWYLSWIILLSNLLLKWVRMFIYKYSQRYVEHLLTFEMLKLICQLAPALLGMNLSPYLSLLGEAIGLEGLNLGLRESGCERKRVSRMNSLDGLSVSLCLCLSLLFKKFKNFLLKYLLYKLMHMGKSVHSAAVKGASHTLDPLIPISINVKSDSSENNNHIN